MERSSGIYDWLRGLVGRTGGAGRTPAERSVLHDLGYTVLWLLAVVVLCAALFSAISLPQQGAHVRMAFVGLCGLVTLTAGAAGGAAGFLFGIPRTLADDGTRVAEGLSKPEARYTRSNTNLEQISDWLTKIVVGATLVQLNTIWPGLIAFGQTFEASVTRLPGLSPLTGIGVLVPVLVTLGFITGFLSLYLQTRTFLAIMFARTEYVMSDPKLGLGDLDILKQAAIRVAVEGEKAPVSEAARELARRALGSQSTESVDADTLRQRGFAQVVLGQLAEGANTIKRAYEQTGDEELGRIASRLLARTNRPGEARDMLPSIPLPQSQSTVSEADADVWLTRMFVALYEPEPLGFNEALRIGDSLRHQAVVVQSAKRRSRLALYTAASLGQCYRYSQATKGAEELQAIRDRAYENASEALAADPGVRTILQNMLKGVGEDDDLTAFKADEDFSRLILGT